MKTLLSKLLAAHLLVLIIAFGLLGLLLRQILYPYYLHQLMGRQLLSRGEALSARISPLLEEKDRSRLKQALEVAKASLGAEICLVDTKRRVLAHAVPSGALSREPPLTTCCPDLSFHGPTLATRAASLTACGRDMLVAAVPVYWPHGEGEGTEGLREPPSPTLRGVLLLRLPISEIHAAAGRLWQLVLLCGLVGLGLALGTALILSDRISGPLRKMRAMAAKMAKGDFGARLQTRGRDEVGQLASSFNILAERLEESLARLEDETAKLRGVLSSMAEGVLAIGGDERILLANPQTFGVLNLPQRELVGRPLEEAGLPEELIKVFRSSLAERKMIREEISTSWAGGGPLSDSEAGAASLHVVPMHLGQDRWGAVAVIRDISEARRLEGMRRRFFSDISHELRTPLTNITGYAAALEDGTAADPADRARALSVILKESERLRRFIEDLLDLSRLESGAPDLQKEWCDLRPLASAAAESLEGLASQAKVKVHLDLPPDFPQVFADPHRLSQVFVNLISNAIHFNRPQGEVIVSASSSPTEIKVMVKDTGVGIAAEELPYVWERFHRVSGGVERSALSVERTNSHSAGTGLGLAIVRSIIQAHGGQVWAESTPGEGSIFGFTLPTD